MFQKGRAGAQVLELGHRLLNGSWVMLGCRNYLQFCGGSCGGGGSLGRFKVGLLFLEF